MISSTTSARMNESKRKRQFAIVEFPRVIDFERGCAHSGVPLQNMDLTVDSRTEGFLHHQPVSTGIFPGRWSKVAQHEQFEFLRRALRTGAHATARERHELSDRATGTGFSLCAFPHRPSACPGHHRIAGGQQPAILGCGLASRNKCRRRTGSFGGNRIAA